jgi:hypothetical protein
MAERSQSAFSAILFVPNFQTKRLNKFRSEIVSARLSIVTQMAGPQNPAFFSAQLVQPGISGSRPPFRLRI